MTSPTGSGARRPAASAWLLVSHRSASLGGRLGLGCGIGGGTPRLGGARIMVTRGSGSERLCPGRGPVGRARAEVKGHGKGHSPCSSLVAAARRVDHVVLLSALGVPGRLLPLELPPDSFRSLFGGVFFFCRDPGEDVSVEVDATPACRAALPTRALPP